MELLHSSMRILHVITDLDTGGAEMMLLRLLASKTRDYDHAIVSLQDEGTLGPRFSKLGVPIFSLGLRKVLLNPVRVVAMRSITRKLHPSLIVGWMYHGNVMASLARTWAPERPPLVWNIRQSLHSIRQERIRTRAIIRLGASISPRVEAIVYNSSAGIEDHERLGYRAAKQVVIPNGFDDQEFKPDALARHSVRTELGLGEQALLVGLVARYHPVKDHESFLRAAGCVAKRYSNVYFLLVGNGVTQDNPALSRIILAEKLAGRAFLLGERSDIPRLTASLDIACSTSAWAEGFSNTIGEAMASGVPCIVTNTGDGAQIVADTGFSVPPGKSEALAQAICTLLDASAAHRQRLGAAARLRIQKEFSLQTVVKRYEEFYEDLVKPQKVAAT